MNRHDVSDYVAARSHDDAIIGNRKCAHGTKLLTCGHMVCIMRRANLLRVASNRGER